MTLRRAALALLLLSLSGCVTYPDITQSRSPCRMDPGGWCGFVREAAEVSYPYALAATNAYVGDSDVYAELGNSLVRLERLPIDEDDADTGFDYQVFAQFPPSPGDAPRDADERAPDAYIMAFRGTDFDGPADIFYGTVRDDQLELAHKYFDLERARFHADAKWITTGHSLGGALAAEISIRHADVKAWMFNVSPFYRGKSMVNDGNRTVINERGEALRSLRKFRAAPASDLFVINCTPQAGRFTKHKIRPLADCITWIAAYESKDALSVVKANDVRKPAVECGEEGKKHPGPGTAQTEPCVHVARLPDDD